MWILGGLVCGVKGRSKLHYVAGFAFGLAFAVKGEYLNSLFILAVLYFCWCVESNDNDRR